MNHAGFIGLPPEMVIHIFSFLPVSTLFTASRVCRTWHNFSTNNILRFLIHSKNFYFDEENKNPRLSISHEGRLITFENEHNNSWSTCRCAMWFRWSSGVVYWEVLMRRVDGDKNSWKAVIGVIAGSHDCKLRSNVGSWGYVAGDGSKVKNYARLSEEYGSAWTGGDIIGVLLIMNEQSIAFFKNGIYQGIAFTDIPLVVWPSISLTAANDEAELQGIYLQHNLPSYVKKLFENGSVYVDIITSREANDYWETNREKTGLK